MKDGCCAMREKREGWKERMRGPLVLWLLWRSVEIFPFFIASLGFLDWGGPWD